MRARRVPFLLIPALLWALTAYNGTLVWAEHPFGAISLSLVVFAWIFAWQIVYQTRPALVGTLRFRVLAWGGSLLMGAWAVFTILSIPMHGVRLIGAGTGWGQSWIELLPGALFWISLAIAAVGFLEVWRGPRVRRHDVPIDGLPPELDGFTVAQVSDLHVGSTIQSRYVARVVALVNALGADVVALTGDIADGEPNVLAPHFALLAGLKSTHGTFYVTGNHEYYWDGEAWVAQVQQLGHIALINEGRVVEAGGRKVLIAGVPDTSAGNFVKSHHPDAERAHAAGADADLKILLAHRPDSCVDAEPLGFHLQLSGHTHAGQFFPFNLLVSLAHDYLRGLHRHGRMWVHVNPGTGYWGPANRFSVASEVTCLRLTRRRD